MGVTNYEENGKQLWRVYVHVRSKTNRKVRAQKILIGITSKEVADHIYLREYHKACSYVAKRENEGLTWGEVVEAWRDWYSRYPSSRWNEGTVRDYIAIMYNWTEHWLKRPVKSLTVADGFEMIELARKMGATTQRLYQIKTTVNVIYKWGLGAGKITDRDHSPVFGIELAKKDKDQIPEILNRDQVAELLQRAEQTEHEWYPIWKFDAYTGLRAAELDGLRHEDMELIPKEKARELDKSTQAVKNYGTVRVQRQWRKLFKSYGELKGRYWRTVPVSSQLYWFLVDYLADNDFGSDEFGKRVFPLLSELRRGQQAMVLKQFCRSQGLKPIKFHTLRACFATHLLAAGVPEAKVMKIGGWKDRETMMVYVRMAGIDEAGATEALDLRPREEIYPETANANRNVVNLFSRK
jgi:integrase